MSVTITLLEYGPKSQDNPWIPFSERFAFYGKILYCVTFQGLNATLRSVINFQNATSCSIFYSILKCFLTIYKLIIIDDYLVTFMVIIIECLKRFKF